MAQQTAHCCTAREWAGGGAIALNDDMGQKLLVFLATLAEETLSIGRRVTGDRVERQPQPSARIFVRSCERHADGLTEAF